MRVSEAKTRFDQETGEPCGTLRKTRHHRCDYCGRVLPATEDGYAPVLSLDMSYGDSDPCFGSGTGEHGLIERHGSGAVHAFLGQPYAFCNEFNHDGCGAPLCEAALALELLACTVDGVPEPVPPEGMGPLDGVRDFDSAFRAARVRAAAKLIADGEVPPEELLWDDD